MTTPSPVPKPALRRGALWISVNGSNTLFFRPLRRFIFSHASTLVVLNGELAGYGNLVQAIRQEFPSIKILRYSNAQRIPERRVASTMFQHFWEHRETEVLKKRTGTHAPQILQGETKGHRTILADITVEAARDYIVSHIAEQVTAHGTDGVAIDSFHAELDPESCFEGKTKAPEWPTACASILQRLHLALPGKLIWFNGIWSFRDQAQVEAQSALLNVADGASVEFYGYDGRENAGTGGDTFEVFVERINTVLGKNPDRPLLVRGTTGPVYFDYVTHLQQARYCYGCYLLATTAASFFSFGQSFQLTRLPKQRTGAASMSAYLDLDIGQPAGPATDNGSGGKSRHYSGGDVFVAPAGHGPQTWTLVSDAWTSTGVKHDAGTPLVLGDADAAILLRVRPAPPPATIEVNLADYIFNKPRFTREWMVDGISREHQYEALELRVRSTDPGSAILVRFETDDTANPPFRPFGILAILPEAGTFDPGSHDYPFGHPPMLGAIHPSPTVTYPTTGAWTDLAINLNEACGPFSCFRVISVRTIRGVEVALIRLGKPVILPDLDPGGSLPAASA